ncbi:HNH endonuclease [Neisseria weaveri]|uniref:Uncharacterized protein n=1 Tax=Neisseria weaveri TaxID=28091 RepID=A0A448VNC7_9NEIS|nr:HNH endonuclease [Neisseria weaveri]EGV35170.1 hypothetical protein l11_21770 [Neisseria weaveri LMG 5135]VEJ51309.1 Uncharacterised protein [Neisseria weaveri]
MAAIRQSQMINILLDAIQASGGSAIFLGGNSKPYKFIIQFQNNRFELWVYIWTVTHGGGQRSSREFRIQMTSVDSPLATNPNGYTVLMGYSPELSVFAGFSLEKHKTFTAGSPSIQINLNALDTGLQNGFGFSTKDNSEIAIGIRPDLFIQYCLNAKALHETGNIEILPILVNSIENNTNEEISTEIEKEIEALPLERKLIVQKVQKLSRESKFRKIVISAYDNRCAISRMQLKLLDAAHILPVASNISTDHVTNGLALNPTLHRAYDNSLIYIDENFEMQINPNRRQELYYINQLDGIDYLEQFVGRVIYLPQDKNQRPNINNIIQANIYRNIPKK